MLHERCDVGCFGLWAFLARGLTRTFLRLTAWVVAAYLLLTAVVVGSCLWHLLDNPQLLEEWWRGVPGEVLMNPGTCGKSGRVPSLPEPVLFTASSNST